MTPFNHKPLVEAAKYAWVLAYILRFPNEEGEWAQVLDTQAFLTERAAHEHKATLKGTYQVCRVLAPDDWGHTDAQAARIKELEEALKPFAAAADELEHSSDPNNSSIWEHPAATDITCGHLRRAAVALEPRS